ncbi:MAG TPA: DUF47 family protein [Armatimonadota bacterium]|jgi:hypothetical protein
MKLEPKEARFFALFDTIAECAERAAVELETLCRDLSDVERGSRRVKSLETEADVAVHEISKRLSASMVVPLDREDILALASGLDDIVDCIEATADRLALYSISSLLPDLGEMGGVLLSAVREVRQAVRGLQSPEGVDGTLKHCLRANELENRNDQLLRLALKSLFDGTTDALAVLKWKEILDQLEAATDACEDVANVVETILVKHAGR